MLPKVELCRDCPSFLTPPGYCEPVGSGVNQVLLVGSSPDRAAVQLGQAYSPYSEVGTVLARACQLREMDLDQFTYTNLTWCPASPRREVLNYCAVKHLRPLIERLQPRMIVALGPDVIRELTGITGPKTDPRYTRGFVVDGINAAAGYPVKLTYDPLMVREGNMNLLGALAQDLDMARTQVKQVFRPDYKVGLEHCAPWFFDAKAHPDLGIGVDIETGTSLKNDEDEVRGHSDPITQIQFSIRPGEALILPWSERAKEFTKIVMALPNPKLSWNGWLFDWPRLRAEGVEIAGADLDLMWMWHFLEPGLPYNLSHCAGTFAGNELPPWKHTMSADLHRYGGLDVDSLVRIYPRLVEALNAEGMAEAYGTFIVRFWKVLKDMSDRGFPFNLEKAAELREWVEGEKARIFADIQERIPNTLKNVHPKEGYKKKPSPKSPGFKEEEGVMWAWDKEQNCWTKLETRTFGEEERWVRVKPFLVTSSDQIKRYAASKGQQLYKVKDGHKYKESTGKKELMKMVQKYGDPFYRTVVEYRELDKIAGNYLEWNVTPAGRVHCEHHFGPESGQIDTRSPNIHTIPKGTPLAKKVRACVTAGPGRKLVEIDATAFHAKTLGYCARDASYMRLSALDIHSFFAAHLLHLPDADTLLDLGDDELRDRLRWIKDNHTQIRNKKAKPALLGMGFGLGADKLYRMNEDSFENVAEAKRTIDMMKGIFPKIFDYQTQTRNLAHAQKFLKTEFGCIRRFYDVFRWDYVRGVWRSGDQAEECIAFPPANIAHCHFKLAMMRLEDRGLLEKYHLIAYIKDALIFECPESLVDECVHEVKMELEAPSTILVDPEVAPGGFAVGTEAEVGTDWSRMEHYRL